MHLPSVFLGNEPDISRTSDVGFSGSELPANTCGSFPTWKGDAGESVELTSMHGVTGRGVVVET